MNKKFDKQKITKSSKSKNIDLTGSKSKAPKKASNLATKKTLIKKTKTTRINTKTNKNVINTTKTNKNAINSTKTKIKSPNISKIRSKKALNFVNKSKNAKKNPIKSLIKNNENPDLLYFKKLKNENAFFNQKVDKNDLKNFDKLLNSTFNLLSLSKPPVEILKSNFFENYFLPKSLKKFKIPPDFYKNAEYKKISFCILRLTNFRFEKIQNVWNNFEINKNNEKISNLINLIFNLFYQNKFNSFEQNEVLLFFSHVFNSYESQFIREIGLKYLTIKIWDQIDESKLQSHFIKYPNLQQIWVENKQNNQKFDKIDQNKSKIEKIDQNKPIFSNFIPNLIKTFFKTLFEINFDGKTVKNKQNFLKNTTKKSKNDEKTAKISKNDEKTAKNEKNEKNNEKNDEKIKVTFFERTLRLLIDLLSQIDSRRYLNFSLTECYFIDSIKFSDFYKFCIENKKYSLFCKLVEILDDILNVKIDEETEEYMPETEVKTQHNIDLAIMQRIAFKYFKEELEDVAMFSLSQIENSQILKKQLNNLSLERLKEFCYKLCILPISIPALQKQFGDDKEFLIQAIISTFTTSKNSEIDQINSLALYPTEDLMWDKNFIPGENAKNSTAFLALPKLNLHFLTLQDYLTRNFLLYRLESCYQIREDISNVIFHLRPVVEIDRITAEKSTIFAGYSRMAVPIEKVVTTKIGKPKLGQTKPSSVIIEVQVDLAPFKNTRKEKVFKEWEELKKHDILFLCSINATKMTEKIKNATQIEKPSDLGLETFRGGEIVEVKDAEYCLVGRRDEEGNIVPNVGTVRTFVLKLDCAQYEADLKRGRDFVYSTFNILIRRKAKENNFKAVLATIRDLMNSKYCVPYWLKHLFTGKKAENGTEIEKIEEFNNNFDEIGEIEPKNQNLTKIDQKSTKIDQNLTKFDKNSIKILRFFDTFVDRRHLKNSLKDYKINFDTNLKDKDCSYSLKIDEEEKKINVVETENEFRSNFMKFTPNQIKSIMSGMQKGLTLIVGPPGTGKTDCAVQIISNWFLNNPNERTLIITHSNAALNDLFEKIAKTGIDEQYLLRLGYGYKELETAQNFGKSGRLNFMLLQRKEFLERIGQLFKSLNLGDGTGFTCENASKLFFYHITARWEEFLAKAKYQYENCEKAKMASNEIVAELFPFTKFFIFDHGISDLFSKKSFQQDLKTAKSLYAELEEMNEKIKNCIPFEVLRSLKDRGDFLAASHAKIVAMTCTHAALKKRDLADLRFEFDNIIMEESAQILEIETFIAITLQNSSNSSNRRLKRLVLIGDHHQLPPVVKNISLKRHARLDQSLFARLLRLGLPAVHLDFQGRCRPSLAALFSWQYQSLFNLSSVVPSRFLTHLTQNRPIFDKNEQKINKNGQKLNKNNEKIDKNNEKMVENNQKMIENNEKMIKNNEKNQKILNKIDLKPKLCFEMANAGFATDFQFIQVDEFNSYYNGEFDQNYPKISKIDQNNQKIDQNNLKITKNGEKNSKNGEKNSKNGEKNSKNNEKNSKNDEKNSKNDEKNPKNNQKNPKISEKIPKFGIESAPTPHHYQNLGEAEFVVQVFIFMRLLGYPSEKIVILTTYNGQKNLLRDVVERRCAADAALGRPAKISTVDKFQGRQSDFVLLSLVRSSAAGHLRDARRLVVALSRARLGLYVFGRSEVFEGCFGIKEGFKRLLKNGRKLKILRGERFGECFRPATLNGNFEGNWSEVTEVKGLWDMARIVEEMQHEIKARNSLKRLRPFQTEFDAKKSKQKKC